MGGGGGGRNTVVGRYVSLPKSCYDSTTLVFYCTLTIAPLSLSHRIILHTCNGGRQGGWNHNHLLLETRGVELWLQYIVFHLLLETFIIIIHCIVMLLLLKAMQSSYKV